MAGPYASSQRSSDLFESDDPDFLDALQNVTLPGDAISEQVEGISKGDTASATQNNVGGGNPSQPPNSRKRPRSPESSSLQQPSSSHSVMPPLSSKATDTFEEADPGTYGASKFDGFGEYMRRKRAKLQVQNNAMEPGSKSRLFKGLDIYVSITVDCLCNTQADYIL